jgi:hypothetical protein
MSAYEPTRRPGGREPLRGALPDEVELDEDALEGRVTEHELPEDTDEAPELESELVDPTGTSGEELIDASGRNPTQRKIDADSDDEEE